MKQIYQYRYYGNDNDKNQPSDIAESTLISGSIFTSRIPILQLGIQSLPGTKFYLNNSLEPIIIGSTGIYELDLQDEATISALRFDRDTINKINTGKLNDYCLLVDIVYEDGEEQKMGFYGNITNQSSTQFKFDKIYNNRVELDANVNTDGVYIGRYVLVEYGDDTLKQSSLIRAYLKEIDSNGNGILYTSPNFERTTRLYVQGDTSTEGQACAVGTAAYVLPEDSGEIASYVRKDRDEIAALSGGRYYLKDTYFTITADMRADKSLWTRIDYSEQGSSANKKAVATIKSDIKAGKTYFYLNKTMELVTSVDDVTESKLISTDGGFWTLKTTQYLVANAGEEYNSNTYYFKAERDTLYSSTVYFIALEDGTPHFVRTDFPFQSTDGDGIISSYTFNYQTDIAKYGAGRGYDSTVWQKVFENNTAKYVMIAELNAVVPTFDISADAPTMTPITPHFDKNSTNVYYKVHWQPQWGLRVKAAENYNISQIDSNGSALTGLDKTVASTNTTVYPSDSTTQWVKYEYNPSTGEEQSYVFDADKNEWVAFDDTPLQELGAAIYFNKAGFTADVDHKASDDVSANSNWKSTVNEIKIAPTGQSGHRYNTHDGTNKDVKEDIQEISIMLPGIGDAVSEMWDLVYGDREQNQKYNTELLNNADGRKRNMDVAWRARTDNTDEAKDYRLRGTLDEQGHLRSYDDKDSAINTVAGCINSVHDLMGMIIREEDPANGLDPSAIYFNNNTYYRLQKEYKPSKNSTTKLSVIDNSAKTNYYYKVGENYYKAKSTTPVEYNFYDLNPSTDFKEVALNSTWAKDKYWYQGSDETGAITYTRDTSSQPDETRSYFTADDITTKYIQFYQQGQSTQENVVIDSIKQQKTCREKNEGYFYRNGKYYYVANNSVNANNYTKDTYYILDENGNYQLDGSGNFDNTVTYYDRKPMYVLETASEDSFAPSANKTYYVLPNKIQYIYKTFSYTGSSSRTDWTNVPDSEWKLVNEEYVETGEWSALSVDDLVKFEENKYFLIKETNNTYRCTTVTKNYLTTNNLYGTGLAVCTPNFTLSTGFYTSGKYYYKQDDNYLKDSSPKQDTGKKYYDLINEPSIFAGQDSNPERYFFDENKVYYDATGNKIEGHKYVAGTTYYQLNNLYVINTGGNEAFRVGAIWNPEAPVTGIWTTSEDGSYEYTTSATGIKGVRLAYLEATGKYVGVELEEFAKKLNTIHGLILQVNKILGENPDTYLGPTDPDTISGCISMMKDIIYKIDSLTPGDITIVDEYGRIHGASHTTAQGFGYTNIGKTSASKSIGAAAEDQFIQLEIDTDKDTPLITVKHQERHSVADTVTSANKNAQSASDTGLNIGVGDTLKLFTPIIDNAGHVVGQNTEEVILPYGFKTITTNGRVTKDNTTSLSAQNNIVADNTQDTLAINSGNEWVKIETDANGDKITISHDAKNTSASTSTKNLSTETSGTTTFEIPSYSFDATNHFISKDIKTVTMPNSYGKFTGDNGSSEASATHDTFAINGDSWLQTKASTDKLILSHIGPVEVAKRNPTNLAPAFGETFTLEDWRFDDKGHKAGLETHTVKIPGVELIKDTAVNENVLVGISYAYDNINHKGVFTELKENLGTLTLPTYSLGTTSAAAITQGDTLNEAFAKTQANINLINNTTIPNAITTCKTYTNTAISNLINGAPETLDTLKEIADWIANDETGTTALTNRVSGLETSLSAETLARGNADTTLQNNISSLDEKISSEIEARTNGDTDTLEAAKQYTDDLLSGAETAEDGLLAKAKGYTDESITNLNLGTMSTKNADDYLLVSDYTIPVPPTTAGTYTLQVVVDEEGKAIYSWIGAATEEI